MYEGEALKYGRINEGASRGDLIPTPVAASQAFKAKSGRFVTLTAGLATIAVAASTRIYGHMNTHEHTPAVNTKFGVDVDQDAIYRIPINAGTYVAGMRGDYCDISIASGIQGADLTASSINHFIIVDGDTVNNKWVDVKINPSIMFTGAGAEA